MRNYFGIFLFSLVISGCGEGGSTNSESSPIITADPINPATSIQIDYSDNSIYPIFDAVSFTYHSIDDIFMLSDGSAWQIVGTSNLSNSTGATTSNVVISTATPSTPDPAYGVRSDLYLVGDSINPAFYINSIPMPVVMTDAVSFTHHSIEDIFTLSDGSAWQIVGTSNLSKSTGATTSNVVIYTATPSTPDPQYGVRSDLYLVGDGINPAFFITPI